MFVKLNLILEKLIVDLIKKRKKEKEDEEYFRSILESRQY